MDSDAIPNAIIVIDILPLSIIKYLNFFFKNKEEFTNTVFVQNEFGLIWKIKIVYIICKWKVFNLFVVISQYEWLNKIAYKYAQMMMP